MHTSVSLHFGVVDFVVVVGVVFSEHSNSCTQSLFCLRKNPMLHAHPRSRCVCAAGIVGLAVLFHRKIPNQGNQCSKVKVIHDQMLDKDFQDKKTIMVALCN